VKKSHKKLNFITNITIKNQVGGWDGANFRLFNEISKYFDVELLSGISPPILLREKIISKAKRLLNRRGDFFFFSRKRLSTISSIVKTRVDQSADVDFFFGATPWIDYHPNRPYAIYLDATFKTYLEIFLKKQQFDLDDVERICQKESVFIKQASWVFWGSKWALYEGAGQYGFEPKINDKDLIINIGGNLPIPKAIVISPSNEVVLLFISLNFEMKGGFVCFDAFKKLKSKFQNIKLKIIGQQPPQEVLNYSGVVYLGHLKKENLEHMSKFTAALETANFLVHPTKMDTVGAVIIEAGFYGCPSIAPRMFGIPDLIDNGKTGYLMDQTDSETIVRIVSQALSDLKAYQQMRKACFDFFTSNLSWEVIGAKTARFILRNFR
jgi:glycosyltransferase involved in cell wall biosynthesis